MANSNCHEKRFDAKRKVPVKPPITTLRPIPHTLLLFLLWLGGGSLAVATEPSVVLLWPKGAPGSEGKPAEEALRLSPTGERVVSSVHRPSLTVYLPSKDTATG